MAGKRAEQKVGVADDPGPFRHMGVHVFHLLSVKTAALSDDLLLAPQKGVGLNARPLLDKEATVIGDPGPGKDKLLQKGAGRTVEPGADTGARLHVHPPEKGGEQDEKQGAQLQDELAAMVFWRG